MKIKTATLIALLGTALSVALLICGVIARDFFRYNIEFVEFLYLIPGLCHLIFFIVLYKKQP